MNESHPMKISREKLDTGSTLADLAAQFKASVQMHPGATMRMTGNGMIASMMQDRLERTHGVPSGKIQIVQVVDPQYQDSVDVVIVFFTLFGPPLPPAGKRKVSVEFKLDLDALPIKVEFEVSPDGTVEEINTNWYALKAAIGRYAHGGRVQNIKIATKVAGVANFDRQALGNLETALKAKVRTAFSMDMRFGNQMTQMITIEFYGEAAAKFKGDEVKPIFEGGMMLSVPHNLL